VLILKVSATTTSWTVAGVGAAVSAIGAAMAKRNKLGAGVLGFGLAHVVLGFLDRYRPTVHQ
jgi:hypothetical protein